MTFQAFETSDRDGTPVELYKFSFGNGSFYYTSGDAEVVMQGARYSPDAISRTEIEHDLEDNSGTITVSLPHDSPVSVLFQAYLPSSPVKVEIYRVHRTDSDQQFVMVYAGSITAAAFSEFMCELTCQPASHRLGRQVPSTLFQQQCTHVLFSQTEYSGTSATNPRAAQTVGCALKKQDYRTDATLTLVASTTLKAAAFATKSDGYFTGGVLELSNGEVRYITSHNGDTVTIAYPAVVGVGEQVAAYPGCDGLENTCKTKFNNVINFAGFTRIPTQNPYNSGIQ